MPIEWILAVLGLATLILVILLPKRALELERLVREESLRHGEEAQKSARENREELILSLKTFNDSLLALTKLNDQKLETIRQVVEQRLETIRITVDEKLHETLEKRLGDSFLQVSRQLEMVHKGLGEMQTLAAGVGDLKKVLTNVKTRGVLGEIQLGNLLEQILTPEQYGKNVATKKGSSERVEYAIRLPSREDGNPIWLPIDAKFPQEDYERLIEAQERGDAALAEEATKSLVAHIREEAKQIKEKYLDPPHTTDFGMLFLPSEGLYAEILRAPGLWESLQRESQVVVSGPTTLSAFLNSLQMGFRTLAVEKRSSEVWLLLGAVKTEFGKFGAILEKTQKKLEEATHTIEDAAQKSRTIERKLKGIQKLPARAAENLLAEVEDAQANDLPNFSSRISSEKAE